MTSIVFTLLFLLSPVSAEFNVPALTSPVVDEAGLLDGRVRVQLEQALRSIRSQGGPQVSVLAVTTIDPYTIEEASIRVAKQWGLGSAEKDDGVLLMVAKKERKVRIEVGQALEADLTDAYSRRIIDNEIVPLFRSGDFDSGVLVGVRGILLRMNPPIHLEDHMKSAPIRKRRSRGSGLPPIAWIIIIILFVVFRSLFGGGGGGRGRGFYGGGGFGGFGGGSGGGWSGGGGGFSGGGASGSW